MKNLHLMTIAFLLSSCNFDDTPPKKAEPRIPPPASEAQTSVADSEITTCVEVFAKMKARGLEGVAVPTGLSTGKTADSLPFDMGQRVGDGDPATASDAVGIVSIWTQKDLFHGGSCTGTLIDESWVLTAAHCGMAMNPDGTQYVKGLDSTKVYVGSLEKHKDVSGKPRSGKFYCHPGFTPSLSNDIALIRLDTPVTNEPVVALPRRTDVPMSRRSLNTEMFVFGYGAVKYDPNKKNDDTDTLGDDVESEILRTGKLALVPPRCHRAKDGKVFCSKSTGEANAPNIGLCKGDSGGPLFLFPDDTGIRRQFGVNSFMSGGKCGEPSVQSGFTDVSRHLDWIAKVTGLPF